MSRIDDLIAELCPDGVEFERLHDIGRWYGGGTPSKHKLEYWQHGTIPWLSPKDMGKPVIKETEDYITPAAVAGSATRLVPANSVAIVVRSSILDRVLPIAFVPMPITLNQDMRAVVTRNGILPEFIAHLLRSRGPEVLRIARKTGGSVASIEAQKLMAFRIPVPPITIQREVVKMLNTFTELEAELEAMLELELLLRRQQYAHCRDALLSFTERTINDQRSTINDQRSTINDQRSTINDQRSTINDQRSTINDQRSTINDQRSIIPWIPMGNIGKFFRGRRFTKTDYAADGIPCIHYGEIYTNYGTSANVVISFIRPDIATQLRFAKPGDVVITDVGETVADVGKAVAWVGCEDVAIHDHCYAFRHSMNPKFVAYYMQTTQFIAEKAKYVARTKVNTLLIDGFSKIPIPVPPLEEQERIVTILDSFDALVNDLSVGLPAELNARRKQYEYYRDKLLTFEERSA